MERKKNAKEIATEYRMAQWAGIMRERAESGLSIVKYCAREGMPTKNCKCIILHRSVFLQQKYCLSASTKPKSY